MKHMKKLVFAALAVMMIAMAALVGCGEPAVPETLEGTSWKATKVEVTVADDNGVYVDHANKLAQKGITMTFQNGKATVVSGDINNSVDYQYADGKIIITGEDTVLDGNTMTVEDGGIRVTFEKQ